MPVRYGMGTIKSFEEIDAWKEARQISLKIYELTRRKGFAKDFGLKDQIRRAAVSIMSNIAEGYESQTIAIFIRHLGIAKGSAGELRCQLYVALDQSYITNEEFDLLCDQSRKISSQIARFKAYLETHRTK